MELTLLHLYNADLKLGTTLKRTKDKKYKIIKQITPNRNINTTTIYEDLEPVKKELFCDIINGYVITQNIMGLSIVDELLNYTPEGGCIVTSNVSESSPDPGLCVSKEKASSQQLEDV